MLWGIPQAFQPALASSSQLYVLLLQLHNLLAFLWICKSCHLSFIAHEREIIGINPFVLTVIQNIRGREGLLHLPSGQQKSLWQNAVCVRLWIKCLCWANVMSKHDAWMVFFILLASQQQKICWRKLLSAMIHTHFYPEHLSQWEGKEWQIVQDHG